MILIYSFPIIEYEEKTNFLLLDKKPIGRVSSKDNLRKVTLPCYLVSSGTWLEKLFDKLTYLLMRKRIRKVYSRKMANKIKRIQYEKILQYR